MILPSNFEKLIYILTSHHNKGKKNGGNEGKEANDGTMKIEMIEVQKKKDMVSHMFSMTNLVILFSYVYSANVADDVAMGQCQSGDGRPMK